MHVNEQQVVLAFFQGVEFELPPLCRRNLAPQKLQNLQFVVVIVVEKPFLLLLLVLFQ